MVYACSALSLSSILSLSPTLSFATCAVLASIAASSALTGNLPSLRLKSRSFSTVGSGWTRALRALPSPPSSAALPNSRESAPATPWVERTFCRTSAGMPSLVTVLAPVSERCTAASTLRALRAKLSLVCSPTASPSTSVPVTNATPSAMAMLDSTSLAVRARRPARIVFSIFSHAPRCVSALTTDSVVGWWISPARRPSASSTTRSA